MSKYFDFLTPCLKEKLGEIWNIEKGEIWKEDKQRLSLMLIFFNVK